MLVDDISVGTLGLLIEQAFILLFKRDYNTVDPETGHGKIAT